jgi:Leucine-rich repeat (LRR) protein
MKLNLDFRGLTTLDGVDLTGVTELWCDSNQLTLLPPLPETLEILCCHSNQLTSLPHLPETLEELDYNSNQLTLLPDLPWGLKDLEEEKLDQHNKKRIDLQMNVVGALPDKGTWDQINEHHTDWQYRIGGEKYNEAVSAL